MEFSPNTHDSPPHIDIKHHTDSAKYSKARSVAAVMSLSLGCFTFVSTELMPVGVLPSMAQGLNVSLGAAGYLITVFAFVVALTAAPLTSVFGGINRKVLMAGLLAVCCIGNLITFLAPSYSIVFLARILVAGAIGVFWSTAVVTAVHLVSQQNAVRATSAVFGGVSLAAVFGIPAGTLLGESQGWHAVFAALALLSLFAFTIIAWSVPAVKMPKPSKGKVMYEVLSHGPLIFVFAVSVLVVTGNFLAYTYITPYLEQIAHRTPGEISALLLVYGGAGVIMNFAIGPFALRWLGKSLGFIALLLAISLACMDIAIGTLPGTFIILAAWGGAYGALPVLLQTSVFKRSAAIEGGSDPATAISVALFNAAIGIGSLLGGLIINFLGPHPLPYISAAFVFAGVLVLITGRDHTKR